MKPHERSDSSLPRTPDSDRIGDSAVNYCEAVFLEHSWKFRRQEGRNDFGIDAEGEIVESNQVTGRIFKLQVKGSESLDAAAEVHRVAVKRSTYNLWQAIPLPVVALLCDVQRKTIYWTEPLSQVPTPGSATVTLRFYAPQTLPETFADLERLLSTWFVAYSDNILVEVPYFYEIFYDRLKTQLDMDFGCSIDDETDLLVRLFYRHLLQLRLRLGLDCTKLPPLKLWYLRSTALWNEYSGLCTPTFDELIIFVEPDYEEAIAELKKRTVEANIAFENYQLKNFFAKLNKEHTFVEFADPRYKDEKLQRAFEKILESRNAVKVRYHSR